MKVREIEIVIEPDGSVKVEAHGFEGKACHLDVEAIAKALGGQEVERKWKPEAREPKRLQHGRVKAR